MTTQWLSSVEAATEEAHRSDAAAASTASLLLLVSDSSLSVSSSVWSLVFSLSTARTGTRKPFLAQKHCSASPTGPGRHLSLYRMEVPDCCQAAD